MQFTWLASLSLIAGLNALFQNRLPSKDWNWISCPSDAVSFGDSCYFFERSRLRSWEEATKYCESKNTFLLSLDTKAEAEFIGAFLYEHDISRQTWYTGGFRNGLNWEWQGIGTNISVHYWHSKPADLDTRIVYNFQKYQYKWSTNRATAQLPFICEIKKWDVVNYKAHIKPHQFGVPFRVNGPPKPPVITKEPSDTVHYHDGITRLIRLSCEASGNPTPTYKWFKNSESSPIQISSGGAAMLNGDLIIADLDGQDLGAYFCEAHNHLGFVRSRKATVNMAYVKQFASSRLNVYGLEGEGKSIVCEEPDHFPAEIGHAWMFRSVKHFVKDSERVFIGGDGTLHFAHLTKADQNPYACNLLSLKSSAGHYGPFFDLIVEKKDSNVAWVQPRILVEYFQTFPSRPVYGEKLTIECIAYGKPTPKIRWDRLDKKLNWSAVEIHNFGRRLVFPRLHLEDNGTYRCIAENYNGLAAVSVSQEIKLNLNVRPVLLLPLKDTLAENGGNVSLVCEGYGVPDLTYEWFHNGRPLSPLLLSGQDIGRIVIDNNRLEIKHILPWDVGAYQCVATNEGGQADSIGYLFVRSFAPSFAKQPDNQIIYAAKGQTLTLPCRPEASGSMTSEWFHGRRPVLTDWDIKAEIASDRGLILKNVTKSCSGDYTCTVRNEVGVGSKKYVLNVIGSLGVKLNPASAILEEGANLTIIAEVQLDSECLETVITWSFNDFPAKDLPTFAIEKDGWALSIVNASGVHNGVVICQVETSAGTVSASAAIEVSRPPPVPQNVQAHSPMAKQIRLDWDIKELGSGSLSSLRSTVEARIQGTDHWFTIQTGVKMSSLEVRNFTLNPVLKPLTTYQFRLRSINTQGSISAPSAGSNWITTLSGPLFRAPSNLQAAPLSQGQWLVTWDALPEEDWHSGTSRQYLVIWRPTLDPRSEHSAFVPSNTTSFLVPLNPSYISQFKTTCLLFHVQVAAVTKFGRSPTFSPPVTLWYSRFAPTAVPRLVSAKVLNDTAVSVRWFVQKPFAPCTEPQAIRVSYGYSHELHDPTTAVMLPLTDQMIIITNLQSGQEYTFNVALWNSAGEGPRSSCQATTYKHSPYTAPRSLSVEQISANKQREFIRIRWEPVTVSSLEEPLTGYLLHIFHSPLSSDYQEVEVPLDSLQHTTSPALDLLDLPSRRLYGLQVLAINFGGIGPPSEKINFTFRVSGSPRISCSRTVTLIIVMLLTCIESHG